MKDIYILGIESSCDDTSAAVLKNGVLLSKITRNLAQQYQPLCISLGRQRGVLRRWSSYW
jgi:hypothetical protein